MKYILIFLLIFFVYRYILANKKEEIIFSKDMCIIDNKTIVEFRNMSIPLIKEINIAINSNNISNSGIVKLKLILFVGNRKIIIKNVYNSLKVLSKLKKYNEYIYNQFLTINFRNSIFATIIDKELTDNVWEYIRVYSWTKKG